LKSITNYFAEIETVNIDEISIEVEQVFVNNIAYYLSGENSRRMYYGGDNISNLAREIFSMDYILRSPLNEKYNSTFDLGEIVGDTLQGIYVVSVRKKDQRWQYEQRRIMITDLGIMARMSDDYLMVWVNSLSGTEPVNRARVNLISDNNQILLDGYTNSKGVVVFKNAGEKIGEFDPFVITVAKDRDLSYLKFSESLLPVAEFDIKGRPFLAKGYECFQYSDRGVYRPGETVHLVNVVRAKDGELPEEFPYMLYINDPRGQEFKKFKLTTANNGLESIDIEIPSFAGTGAYTAVAKIGDDIIGQYSFQVEEFMPDRIKATITIEDKDYNSGDSIEIKANGTYLFGTPCSGNKVNGRVEINEKQFKSDEYPEYIFTDNTRESTRVTTNPPSEILDSLGNHTYHYRIPENLEPPSSLEILASITVLESGGRGVSDYQTVDIHPYPIYLGLLKSFEGYAKSGEEINFSAIAINQSGEAVDIDSVWAKFYRIIYQNMVKKDQSSIFRYVSEEQEQIIDSTLIELDTSPQTISFTPSD
jgi:hypothetical protein